MTPQLTMVMCTVDRYVLLNGGYIQANWTKHGDSVNDLEI